MCEDESQFESKLHILRGSEGTATCAAVAAAAAAFDCENFRFVPCRVIEDVDVATGGGGKVCVVRDDGKVRAEGIRIRVERRVTAVEAEFEVDDDADADADDAAGGGGATGGVAAALVFACAVRRRVRVDTVDGGNDEDDAKGSDDGVRAGVTGVASSIRTVVDVGLN